MATGLRCGVSGKEPEESVRGGSAARVLRALAASVMPIYGDVRRDRADCGTWNNRKVLTAAPHCRPSVFVDVRAALWTCLREIWTVEVDAVA